MIAEKKSCQETGEKIVLARPYLPAGTREAVNAVLDSGYLTEGTVTQRFEALFAAYVGTRHAVAVTSCTTGLELALQALGVGAGDEVLVPDYTYPASATAVMRQGATAVLIDCDPTTLNLDYGAMEAAITEKTKTVMPVSLFGNPLDWQRIHRVADQYGVQVLEDAACGFGSGYAGKRTGCFGDAAVFSLHPRKSLTTGEGGMMTTNNAELAATMCSLKHFGLATLDDAREAMRFVRLGTNAKMSDIVAAVGLMQLEQADALLARRCELAARYRVLLSAAEAAGLVRWPICTPYGTHGWQSCCVCIHNRDWILQQLRAEQIEVQIGTYALHREPLFQNHPLCRVAGSLAGSLQAYTETLALPLYHTMTDEEQQRVATRLMYFLQTSKE